MSTRNSEMLVFGYRGRCVTAFAQTYKNIWPKWGFEQEWSGQRRRGFKPPNERSKEVTGAAKHPRHLTAPRHFAADVSITRKSARRVERNIWVTLLGRRSGKRGAPTTVRARS